MEITLLDNTTCILCGRDFNHRKYYTTAMPIGDLKDGIKICELIMECATCRSILKRKKEIDILFEERKLLAKHRKEEKWNQMIEQMCGD